MANITVSINGSIIHERSVLDRICEFVGKQLFEDYGIDQLRKQRMDAFVIIDGIQSRMNDKYFVIDETAL